MPILTAPRRPLANRLALALLRSPLRGMLSGLVELSYTGRRTGRRVTLPVMYARDGDLAVVLVARAERKTWWRNFVGQPQPVRVRMPGGARHGIAEVLASGATGYPQALACYLRRHPRVTIHPGDRLVAVRLSRD